MDDSGVPLVSAVAVVPCFNEARRLDPERFLPLTAAGVTVLFVDDGSTDKTPEVIEAALTKHAELTSLSLPENRGKGEEEVNPSDPVFLAVAVNRRAWNLGLVYRRLSKKRV